MLKRAERARTIQEVLEIQEKLEMEDKNGVKRYEGIVGEGEVSGPGEITLSETRGTITYPETRTFEITSDTKGRKIKVESSDPNIATVSIDGKTVTITPKAITEDDQRVTITVMVGKKSVTYEATIKQGSMSLEATAYTGTYDGAEHDAITGVTVEPEDAKVEYSLNGGEYSTSIPKVTGGGIYTVSIKASKAGYKTKEITKTITVNKQESAEGNLSLSETSGTIVYPSTGAFTITSNTSGGALSVTSSDTNIATVSISGNTVTITPKAITADGQQVTITVKSAATENYEAQTATYEAMIKQGSILLEATAYTGTYDGAEHDAITEVTVEPEDAKVEYSLDGGAYSTRIPKVTGGGEYTVSIRASKAGYVTEEITKTITVNKQENTNGNLSLSETSGTIVYPSTGTFTITNNTSGGALSVTSSDPNIAEVSISGNTVTITPKAITADGQQVTITVTSAATENYEEQTATYEAIVNRGRITLDATPYTGTYDGAEHDAITEVTVEPEDAEVMYSLDGGEYSTSMPKVREAGEYTVLIKASKAGYETEEITKTATVNKQEGTEGNLSLSETSGTVTYPTEKTFTITNNASGGDLSVTSSNTNIATVSISGNTVTITPKAITVDGQQVTITVKSAATENYEAQTATYEATVNRGSISLEAEAYTGTYDGEEHDAITEVIVEPEDAEIEYALDEGEYSANIPKVTGVATYSVSIRASKAGYVTEEITKTITVNKQENTEGNLSLSETRGTVTYPTEKTFTITKNTSGGALSVTSSDPNIAEVSISGNTVTITPKAVTIDGQQVTITVTSAATENYEAQTATYEAMIKQGSITLEAEAYQGTYDGAEHDAITEVTVEPEDALVEYSLDEGEYSTSIPKVTEGGEYTVLIKASKAGYETEEITKTAIVNKKGNTEGNLSLSETSGTLTYPTTKTFTVTNNTSGGELSVESSNPNIAEVSISGNTVTITPKAIIADGQKVTITVTSAATENYEAQTATYEATIKQGRITLDATAHIGIYDGEEHDAIPEVIVEPDDALVEYALDREVYSTSMPKVREAGEYTVFIRASKPGYVTEKITRTITIHKQESTAGNLTLSETSGTVTYPIARTFTITNNASGGALSVTSSDPNIAEVSISGNTVTITPKVVTIDGQRVTITVKSAATGNYEAQTAIYIATINRGSITLVVEAHQGTYDGNEHNAITLRTLEPADALVEYALEGEEYSTTIPKVTRAKTYTVSIRASKAGYVTNEFTRTVTINKQGNGNGNLSLSATSGTIVYPSTGTFTITKNTSGGALSVISSDTNIATVSLSGNTVTITPKTPTTSGKKVTITVTSAATENYEAQTATYVATITTIPVTGVTVSPTTATLTTIGATKQLTATVSPSNAFNKAVTWSTSNANVATVSTSGLVTAKATGTATITVKTADGNKTATCAVTVTIPVTGVTVSPTTATLTTIGATKQLTATVSPSNASNKNVTWSSSNTGVATVSSSGLVTAKAHGTATITVTTADGNKTATCTVTVQIWTVSLLGDSTCKATIVSPASASNPTVLEIGKDYIPRSSIIRYNGSVAIGDKVTITGRIVTYASRYQLHAHRH